VGPYLLGLWLGLLGLAKAPRGIESGKESLFALRWEEDEEDYYVGGGG